MAANRNSSDDRIPIPTIGEVLTEEFLQPLELTSYRLAKELHVATSSILDIVHNRRKLTADMALRFWLAMQNEIEIRNRRDQLNEDLDRIHPVVRSA